MIKLTAKKVFAPPTSVDVDIEDEDILVAQDAIDWAYEHDDGGTVLVMNEGTHLHVTASPQRMQRLR